MPPSSAAAAGNQCTCFTGTQVQILTQQLQPLGAASSGAGAAVCVGAEAARGRARDREPSRGARCSQTLSFLVSRHLDRRFPRLYWRRRRRRRRRRASEYASEYARGGEGKRGQRYLARRSLMLDMYVLILCPNSAALCLPATSLCIA